MSNKEKCKNEIVVCNTLFKFELVEECSDTYELVVTPCNMPTAVYDIARITKRTNACSGLDYFQAFINTDPVEIIQDCDLENLIQRAIEAYFDNAPDIDCDGQSRQNDNRSNRCGKCSNRMFGLL